MSEVVRNQIAEGHGEDLVFADGYDECIIGVVERAGLPPAVCYSRSAIIKKLIDEGMSEDEAEEFFEFNIVGAYVGDRTPCFLSAADEY